jgi:ATP-dependent RNA helicase DeaD
VGFGSQEQALQDGVDIVVGTPGRILDHLRRRNLDLSKVEFACLDEADEMLSMGFLEDVTKILDQTPKGRQMLLFSATVEEAIKQMIGRYMTDPEDIMLSTDTDKVEGIDHILYETTPDFHKVRALLAILDQEEPSSAIIFCNTREDTTTVATFLARQGLDAELISGELSQAKREEVMRRREEGRDAVPRGDGRRRARNRHQRSLARDQLLATGRPAVYMHRTGRTGRIGKEGIAILARRRRRHEHAQGARGKHQIKFELRKLPTPRRGGTRPRRASGGS